MEAPPKKKIVAKVTANIYEPSSPGFVAASAVRAKVSSSSVSRGSSVVNGGHSRNNSASKAAVRGGGYSSEAVSSPLTRAFPSAPPSSIGRSAGHGLSPNSLLFAPESSSSPASPSTRQQPRITVRQPKRMDSATSALSAKFKANQSYESPPISPPTSPRSVAFSALSVASPATQSPATSPPTVRPRVTSSIRIQPQKMQGLNVNTGRATPTAMGHRSRNPSISSISALGNGPKTGSTARAIPQQKQSPPRLEIPHSPPTSTLSSRSSASLHSSSLASTSVSAPSHLSLSTATEGESDSDQEEEHVERDQASTPQNEVDEDDVFAEEARSNRKILDLEISNQSLLTVNTMLEATKLRQAREIKDLRRKLREVKHLPSKTLYANAETMSPTASDISLPNRKNSASSHSSDEEEEAEAEPDPIYDRIQKLVEGLLSQAHRALERTIDDCMPAPTNTVKVLSAVEVQQYERRTLGLPEEEESKDDHDHEHDDPDISIDETNEVKEVVQDVKEALKSPLEDDLGYVASGEETRKKRGLFLFN
ncbi:SubName: Full=Uncharacterized protein {ECO:0000313/EMBL:CCA70043.1} [Serendipita indica DSM 11827]|nr:SubName: Full=Uncharacterized protein {ECO:0000313/EMBL:CCA70043.1} [Serendipita indica DSM 11827]